MSQKKGDVINDLIDLLSGDGQKHESKYGKKMVDQFTEFATEDPKQLQKQYQDEKYQSYLSKFAHLVHLWRLDDPTWKKTRKEVWEAILAREKREDRHFVKSYWEAAERFFLRAKPRKADNEIYLDRRMSYTPFTSTEQIIELYMNEHKSLRRNLHEKLITRVSSTYRAVPQEFHRVELIAEALYSADFLEKRASLDESGQAELGITYPRDFIVSYTGAARNYLRYSHHEHIKSAEEVANRYYTGSERNFCEVTIDYFLSMLETAVLDQTGENVNKINDLGIKGVKDIRVLVDSYDPDIQDANRDRYVENAHKLILENEIVKDVCNMSV